MRFGYGRVSTKDQNLARQREALEGKCDEYYEDKLSGRNMDRPELQRILDKVRCGDTITILSIDRLGRNLKQLINVSADLKEKGVNIVAVNQGIDTSTKTGEMFFYFLSMIAQLELDSIHERQREGIEIAKLEGRFKGRPLKELKEFNRYLQEVESGTLSVDRACKLLGVSRSTFYRRKGLLNEALSDDSEIDF